MIQLFPLAAKVKGHIMPGIGGNMLNKQGKNLSDCVSGTCDETRTEPEKFIEAACLERAA